MASSTSTKKKPKKESSSIPKLASVSDTLSFIRESKTQWLFGIGCLAGVGNGAVYPILAWMFSNSFSNIANTDSGLGPVRDVAVQFLWIGAYAFGCATIQTGCMEASATRATRQLRLKWFQSLLKQDSAYYDVQDISGIASTIGPQTNKYRRGLGRKFGEIFQFVTTFIGGIVYAFYASWKVAFVVLSVLPLVAAAAIFALQYNTNQSSNSAKAYATAASVAYATVSAIRTVLSLNAVPQMVKQYMEATQDAYQKSTSLFWKQGVANGSMLGTFMLLYAALTLYGGSLIYKDVQSSGCDPSSGVPGVSSCDENGPGVFGAMLGVAFAGQGISQLSACFEAFTSARVATYRAMSCINRKAGHTPSETLYEEEEDETDDDKSSDDKEVDLVMTEQATTEDDIESATHSKKIKAILPPYVIDSSSQEGLTPQDVKGSIEFKNVEFAYPTRPETTILQNFNLMVEAGKTVALVGPSGGGKSTTVSLLERFYDPLQGSIELDGTPLTDLNVTHLRRLIGYVGQEPTLFATTIAGNIRYGKPTATQDEIEHAAKLANAHAFVSSFPDGYETHVGDKGAQLSGGQKQRIAIARVLVANPRILLLDEATSALDSESELIVQDALDNVLAEQKRTTIVIAHRLSTVRNADVIAVISGGTVVELGNHDELMKSEIGEYRNLVNKQLDKSQGGSGTPSRENSSQDLSKLNSTVTEASIHSTVDSPVHFSFQNVQFAYPSRPGKFVLDKFKLNVHQGETMALVGPSGGGKSTVVGLIERFYDPNQGFIDYRDVDIRDLNPQWYRDQIGYVGQEPTLFNTTIGKNIAYGFPNASKQDIEHAAKQANAHDFIMSFPEGYDTPVGERGTQLSGGQKQRIAIARALVKNPQILILDEATSALDSESETIVQAALDQLMASKDRTTIVIAHRLSTIRDVDRIAYIAHGHVVEIGSHEELMAKDKGRYKRLVETQNRSSNTLDSIKKSVKEEKKDSTKNDDNDPEKEKPSHELEMEDAQKNAFSVKRAREMSSPDAAYLIFGALGSIIAGSVFPLWGILFAETIELLFTLVFECSDDSVQDDLGYDTCQDYYDSISDDMRDTSFTLGLYWVLVAVACVVGNTMLFIGFGYASERLSKRTRDASFTALIRQEVAYFDIRSVGDITTELQDDAAKIHAFSGEPIRSFILAMSSILVGVTLSFYYMWPFALVSLATIPLMGFATGEEMKQYVGEDIDDRDKSMQDDNSPGGILVETLLNIRTVSALTMQNARLEDYEKALDKADEGYVVKGIKSGITSGMSMLIQQWVNGLQFWWGGWILFNYPDEFSFNDFLISMFALLFSLFGLGSAFQGISDKKEIEKSAGRVFYLLDRQSRIDPLSTDGKKLD